MGVESSDRDGQVRRKSRLRLLLRYVVIETRLYLFFSKPEVRIGRNPKNLCHASVVLGRVSLWQVLAVVRSGRRGSVKHLGGWVS